MRRVFLDVLSSALLGLGFLFLASPFLLWWWIHGDYERYGQNCEVRGRRIVAPAGDILICHG